MPDWSRPPADFTAIELVRIAPAANARRYYRIAWEPTLLDDHAVIRSFGRKGAWQAAHVHHAVHHPRSRLAVDTYTVPVVGVPGFTGYASVRANLKTRLRHGYRVVGSA